MDEYSFYISTLEAALYYVKTGELTKVLAEDQNKVSTQRTLIGVEDNFLLTQLRFLYLRVVSSSSMKRLHAGCFAAGRFAAT